MTGFGLQLFLDGSHIEVQLELGASRHVNRDGVLAWSVRMKRFGIEQNLVLIRLRLRDVCIVGEGDLYAVHGRFEVNRRGAVIINDDVYPVGPAFNGVDVFGVGLANLNRVGARILSLTLRKNKRA
jgi:hypothetical protein